MSASLGPEFSCENVANATCSCTTVGMWQLSTGKKAEGVVENVHYVAQTRREVNSSVSVVSDVINDLVGRRRVWNMLFDDVPMPSPEDGNVERSYGVLDSYFSTASLKGEEVLELLKKAKK